MIACALEHRAKVLSSCQRQAVPVLSRLFDRRSSLNILTNELIRSAVGADLSRPSPIYRPSA